MGTYNLIDEPWIPVRRRSGVCAWITPWQITEAEDPPCQIASPRPDFDGALTQFLIGLLQTTMTPPGQRAWERHFLTPPSSGELKEAFSPYRDAFWLDGDGPRFLQDLELVENPTMASPVEALLIDAPGENTIQLNKDLFIHRGRVTAMSLPVAAMALLTLQTNAPSGGAGHRTSLRGGGPLSTLVLGRTLWETVWLNVLCRADVEKLPGNQSLSGRADIFPWMAPTRTSESTGGQSTAPHQIHPFQYFWGMPRRIRLSFAEEGCCSLLGVQSARVVRVYTTRPRGVNYEGDFRHPLTPYNRQSANKPWLPRKGQPTGLAYRDWPTLSLGFSETYEPARCVSAVYNEARLELMGGESGRLWVFGYDMDNMKARCWYGGNSPIFPSMEEEKQRRFADLARQCVEASEYARSFLVKTVKQALFRRPQDASGDLSFLYQQFWAATEPAFYETLHLIRQGVLADQDTCAPRERWLATLSNTCQAIFRDNAQLQGEFAAADVRRVADAWNELSRSTHPNGRAFRKSVDLRPVQP